MVQPYGSEAKIEQLKKEVSNYEYLEFWHYVYASNDQIEDLYNSLYSRTNLDQNLATEQVFIVDKDRNQRGRLDAREPNEVEANKPKYSMYDYNCIEVDEIKNKMSEDLRILFTEYRQKRKGQFDSNSRRAYDLKKDNG